MNWTNYGIRINLMNMIANHLKHNLDKGFLPMFEMTSHDNDDAVIYYNDQDNNDDTLGGVVDVVEKFGF